MPCVQARAEIRDAVLWTIQPTMVTDPSSAPSRFLPPARKYVWLLGTFTACHHVAFAARPFRRYFGSTSERPTAPTLHTRSDAVLSSPVPRPDA